MKMSDYMEQTPLGRAEWIKFIGLLFGKKAVADSIFSATERNYSALKTMAGAVPERPEVISETMTNGVWYVPGGASYKAVMYADAGGFTRQGFLTRDPAQSARGESPRHGEQK